MRRDSYYDCYAHKMQHLSDSLIAHNVFCLISTVGRAFRRFFTH